MQTSRQILSGWVPGPQINVSINIPWSIWSSWRGIRIERRSHGEIEMCARSISTWLTRRRNAKGPTAYPNTFGHLVDCLRLSARGFSLSSGFIRAPSFVGRQLAQKLRQDIESEGEWIAVKKNRYTDVPNTIHSFWKTGQDISFIQPPQPPQNTAQSARRKVQNQEVLAAEWQQEYSELLHTIGISRGRVSVHSNYFQADQRADVC